MLELIEELYLTNRAFVTDDYLTCLEYIDDNELPLTYHKHESGTTIWDSWIIPEKWTVNEAYVEVDGERIIDYGDHPLHLISYSEPFEGAVSRETLLDHVHTHSTMNDAIPWHFRGNYRPWDSEWGFCARQSTVESLSHDSYDVTIDTEFEDDEMIVAEHRIEGDADETIVFVAHLDHTGMANDDLAGVAAGCELMRRLRHRDSLRYSYTFLIVQEMTGSAAYLATNEEAAADFTYGVFLEMPGNDNRLLLQESFTGDTRLDRIARHRLARTTSEGDVAGFREHVGNDELIFEGPDFEIPTISVSRYPYPEYHTHFDDPSILSVDRLEAYVGYIESIVDVLETDFVPIRTFTGIPSLAHPKYDLYLDDKQVLDGEAGERAHREGDLSAFADRLFRYLDGDHTAFDIAAAFDLPFEWVRSYLLEFEGVGLVETEKPPMAGGPERTKRRYFPAQP